MGENNVMQGGHDGLSHMLGATPNTNVGHEYAEYANTDAYDSPMKDHMEMTNNTLRTVADNSYQISLTDNVVA